MVFDYKDIEFLVSKKKIIIKLWQNNISINVFGYKNKQAYQIHLSIKKKKKKIENWNWKHLAFVGCSLWCLQ